MRNKSLLFLGALLLLCLGASAQNLKPVKDKQTKKYGYQDKQKNWVIPPAYDDANRFDDDGFAMVKVDGLRGLIDPEGNWILEPLYDDIGKFDKNGVCELKIKEGKHKWYGIANRSGKILLPVVYNSVDVFHRGGCIMASRESLDPGLIGDPLWGVYDFDGNELFAPQFLSEPSLHDGILIAKDTSGLYGAGDLSGRVLLPCEFLAISRPRNGFHTLETSFRQTAYTSDGHRAESFTPPGAIIAYDPMGDKVRAAAWQHGCIGIRLYANQIRAVETQPGFGGRRAVCREADIDWRPGRFLRLEPFVTDAEDPDAMVWPSGGKSYTLKAMLYEADGSLVGEVTDKGYLEAECAEGVIYRAGGVESWLVLADPNSLGLPSYSLNLTGFRNLSHDNVYNGLGIRSSELESLDKVRNFARRRIEIIEGENVGICSYLPPVIDLTDARRMRDIMRPDIFFHAFHMGEVVNCKIRERGEELEIELSDQLVCRFENHFSDPSYSFSGDELIYWGPHNARTVRVSLEPTYSKDALADMNGKFWTLVLSLHEEDGSWLRTLARAPFADYTRNGVLVFSDLGIALLAPDAPQSRPEGRRTIRIGKPMPLPHTVNALEEFNLRPQHRPR